MKNPGTVGAVSGARVVRHDCLNSSRYAASAPADRLLSRLDQVRARAPGQWVACCPAHDDRSPSLSIREAEDGRLLVHCFGACSAADVLAAVGLRFSDLFPDSPGARARHGGMPAWRRERLRDALRGEYLVIEIANADRAAGHPLSAKDTERVRLAKARIRKIKEALRGG